MKLLDRQAQKKMPVLEALERFKKMRVVPFDVPGHKRGRGNKALLNFLGEKCLSVDVNSMKPLDNLCHPVSVIKEAEELAADAFGAEHAFFMVGGTTSAVQTMILTACKRGDKIILPRNVHRSAINAMILCGAIPIYINPQMDKQLGISLGMSVEEVKKAIRENPDAKAVLVNNPTYYGICSNLKEIIKVAHEHNMLVLADEAHGTHFYFNKRLPIAAIHAGADMAAVSMHKSGGSLTQSSFLLTGKNVKAGYVHQIINLTQTTSGSYLLMSSLDISRSNLAVHGSEIFDFVIDLVDYARQEINNIGDYYAYADEKINGDSVFDFDTTKLAIYTLPVGLAGTHRDYLGALMNLGISRTKTGDIIVQDKQAYLIVSESIADYICENLTRIRHTSVMCRQIDWQEFDYKPQVKEVMGSIASVRLDAVIGLAFSQSRSKLTGYISEEKVQVNGKVITSNAYNLKENDLISVRGLGKFRYKGTSAVTKKGRLMASVEVFV